MTLARGRIQCGLQEDILLCVWHLMFLYLDTITWLDVICQFSLLWTTLPISSLLHTIASFFFLFQKSEKVSSFSMYINLIVFGLHLFLYLVNYLSTCSNNFFQMLGASCPRKEWTISWNRCVEVSYRSCWWGMFEC